MDYGIIFLIIIVIIIIIAIILIIYANRDNTQNLLLTLPNYRIQDVSSGGYLGLINFTFPDNNPLQPNVNIYTLNQVPFVPFWRALVVGDLKVDDPLGLWNINILKQISVNVAEVQLRNDVYFNESPNFTLGYLDETLPGPIASKKFTPTATTNVSVTFIMTTIAVNTFTLLKKLGNFPVVIDKSNGLLTYSTNVNVKPTIFRLTLV